MDAVQSKISIFSELTVSSDSETDCAQSTAGPDDVLRVPTTMTEEETSEEEERCSTLRECVQPEPPLIVRLDKNLPKAMVERKKAQEAAVVLREKRKKELVHRKQEERALERKLRFKPSYITITPPKVSAPPKPPARRTRVLLNNPKPPSTSKTAAQFSQLSINNVSSMETGLTEEDIQTFVRQSRLTRDMLNINVKNNKLSMVFDEKSLQCEKMLRREIQRHRAGKNPTYCII